MMQDMRYTDTRCMILNAEVYRVARVAVLRHDFCIPACLKFDSFIAWCVLCMHNGTMSIDVYVCVWVTRVCHPLLYIHKKTSSYPLRLVAYKHGSIMNEVALSS